MWTAPALPGALRGPLGVAAVGAAAGLAMLAVHVAGTTTATTLDRLLLGGSEGWSAAEMYPRNDPHVVIAVVIAFFGDPLVVAGLAAVLAVLCLARGRARLAVVAVAAPALTGSATTLLKPVVGRLRDGYLAFPSGHAAAATSVALVAGLWLASRYGVRPALVLATTAVVGAAMGWAQVVLGIHYPSDTIGGFCTALAVVPVTVRLVDVLVSAVTGSEGDPGTSST